MNFECDGKIYSIPLAKPAEVGMSYSLEEYDIGGEDRAFLFLDSEGLPEETNEREFDKTTMEYTGAFKVDRTRVCIATDGTASRLWQMLCDVGVATKQLYRAEEFEPQSFLALTLEHAREVERLKAIDLDNAVAKTRGKTREQLEAEEALGNGKSLIVQGGKTN